MQQKWVRQYLLVLVDKKVNIKNSHSRGGFNEDDVVVCGIAGLSATARNLELIISRNTMSVSTTKSVYTWIIMDARSA